MTSGDPVTVPLDRNKPQFRARISVFRPEAGGPKDGYFAFPASGFRPVPVLMDRVANMNTVGIFFEPNARISGGTVFEADCGVIDPTAFAGITLGTRFRIWDGRDIAEGEVISLYLDRDRA